MTGPFLFLFVLLHTYRLLGQYRELLRQLALLPMAGAYERLPLKVSFTFGRFLSNFTPRVSNLELVVQQYESLVEDPAIPERTDHDPFDGVQRKIPYARNALKELPVSERCSRGKWVKKMIRSSSPRMITGISRTAR